MPSRMLRTTLKASRLKHGFTLLVRFPGIVPVLLGGGLSAVSQYIDRVVKESYARNPVELKRIHSFDIYLDPRNSYVSPYLAATGSYEMGTTDLFLSLIRKGSTVVDVGANVGWYTMLAARRVGREGHVLSFEPEPRNFALLSRSIARNRFTQVQLFEKAAFEVDGRVKLHLPVSECDGHLPSVVADIGGRTIEVGSVRLDTAAHEAGVDHIDLLKVDAEGAEPQVLRGCGDLLLNQKIRHVIFEWCPDAWANCENLMQQILDNYSLYEIPSGSLSVLKPLNGSALPKYKGNLYLETARRRD